MMRAIVSMALAVLMPLLSGCWDKVEIDRRAFVLGAAVDLAPQSGEVESHGPAETAGRGSFMLTLEVPVLRLTSAAGSGGGTGGGLHGEGKPTWVIASTGDSVFRIVCQMATRSNKVLYFGHQQVLIVGEDLARRHDLREALNFWVRDPEFTWSLRVLVAQGAAKDILNARPELAQSASMFLRDQLEQKRQTSRFIDMNLITFFSKLTEGRDFLLGRVSVSESKDLKVAGSGVIKGGRLQGWLGEEETMAAQLAMGEARGGEIVIHDPENPETALTLEIDSAERQIKADIKDGRPSFTISLEMKYAIAELNGSVETVDEQMIARAEEAASHVVEEMIRATVEKLQNQFEADVLGLGSYLEKHHNREWKKMAKNWDRVYPNVPVSIKVTTKILRTGLAF